MLCLTALADGDSQILQLCLDGFESLQQLLFLARRQELWPWRGQQIVAALHEHLVLLDTQAHSRIEFTKLRIDVGQQRLVVIAANIHHLIE